MKKNRKIFKYILLLVLLSMYSCGDEIAFNLKVIFNADGTFTQILKTDADINNEDESIPVHIDSTWQKTIDIDTTGEKPDTFHIYTKKYASIDELIQSRLDTGLVFSSLNREIEYKKRFLWFFNSYEYSETFHKMMTGDTLSNLLSEEELKVIDSSEKDSLEQLIGMNKNEFKAYKDSLEDIYDDWLINTFYENIKSTLFNFIKGDDALSQYYQAALDNEDSLKNYFKFDDDEFESIIIGLDTLVGANGEIAILAEGENSLSKKYNDFFDIIAIYVFDNEYKYEFELPGKLVKTNADSVYNNTVFYNVVWSDFFTTDLVMKSKSRVQNIWAYYVSGAILLLALLALISGWIRQKVAK